MIRRLRERIQGSEFLRNVLVLMSGTALAQILPILAYPVLTRLYTPRELGMYTAFSALVAALLTIASWRYELAIVLPEKDEDARALVHLSRRLSLATCLVGGIVLAVLADPLASAWSEPNLKPWIAVVGFVAWAYAQVNILNYWCNRHKQYGVMSRNKMTQAIATTGTQIGLGATVAGATGLIMGTLVGQVVAASRLYFKTRADIDGKPSSPLRRVFRDYRKMPLLNGPTAVMDAIRTQGTALLLPAMFSLASYGQYGLAWKLLQTPSALINTSLSQVFFQRLSVTPRGEMASLVRRSITRSASIGILPFAAIFLLSPLLFPAIFGEEWALSGRIAQSLTPWLFLNFITSPVSMLFVAIQRQDALLIFSVPFTVLPIAIIYFGHSDILTTMNYLSWAMSAALIGFLLLALAVARRYDSGTDPDLAPSATS